MKYPYKREGLSWPEDFTPMTRSEERDRQLSRRIVRFEMEAGCPFAAAYYNDQSRDNRLAYLTAHGFPMDWRR